jgi:hypothetical protein
VRRSSLALNQRDAAGSQLAEPIAVEDVMQPINRILVATDFSEDSLHALEYAKEIARRFGAQLIVLHADEMLRVAHGIESRRAAS